MKAAMRIPLRLAPRSASIPSAIRPLHSTVAKTANVAPIVGTGPPPEPPLPAEVNARSRVERRRRQAEMLKSAREIRSAQGNKGSPLAKKRFWKDVTVREVDGKFGSITTTA